MNQLENFECEELYLKELLEYAIGRKAIVMKLKHKKMRLRHSREGGSLSKLNRNRFSQQIPASAGMTVGAGFS